MMNASSQGRLFEEPPAVDGSAVEERLVERMRRIEALLARATSEGERIAAEAAHERVQARLAARAATDPPVELQFTFRDPWCKKVFLALLRRHRIEPYRYRNQRATTVMAKVPRQFLDEELWPEYQRLSAILRTFLERVTGQVVAEVVGGDGSDAVERAGPAALGDGS